MTPNCRLKVLSLQFNDLSLVDAKIMSQGVLKLEHVNLHGTKLTSEQVTRICKGLRGNYKLKRISLTQNYLSLVNANLLEEAIMKLDWIGLDKRDLAPNQVPIIHTAILRKELATFPWSKFAK